MSNLNPQQFEGHEATAYGHPNLTNYRDGGIGGYRDHGVVAMVKPRDLRPFREYDRTGRDARPDSDQVISKIEEDIRSGQGLREPLVLEYSRKHNWAYLGEGHHRLEAAIRANAPVVPVRAVGRGANSVQERKEQGLGREVSPLREGEGFPPGYEPPVLHPGRFLPDSIRYGHVRYTGQ